MKPLPANKSSGRCKIFGRIFDAVFAVCIAYAAVAGVWLCTTYIKDRVAERKESQEVNTYQISQKEASYNAEGERAVVYAGTHCTKPVQRCYTSALYNTIISWYIHQNEKRKITAKCRV